MSSLLNNICLIDYFNSLSYNLAFWLLGKSKFSKQISNKFEYVVQHNAAYYNAMLVNIRVWSEMQNNGQSRTLDFRVGTKYLNV